jgi:hypothetical protein
METITIIFKAIQQALVRSSDLEKLASDTIGYVYAHFNLSGDWKDFDIVEAIWQNDQLRVAVLLDDEWNCIVPMEVLSRESEVTVHLVGSTIDTDSQKPVERLTTYPALALICNQKVQIDGGDEGEVSPNLFEQYIARVQSEVRQVTDMTVDAHESEAVEVIKTVTDVVNLDFGFPAQGAVDALTNEEIEELLSN